MRTEEVFASRGIVDDHPITRIYALALGADSWTIGTNSTNIVARSAMRLVIFDAHAFTIAQVFSG